MGHLDNRYTKSLIHFDGASFTDESGKTWSTGGTAPTISTAQSKWGGLSGHFAGNGWITTPQTSDFDFGAGNFDISLWAYPTAVGQSPSSVLIAKYTGSYAPFLIIQTTGGYGVVLYSSSAGTSWDLASAVAVGTMNSSAWNQIKVCRIGTNVYCFMNGTLNSTTNFSSTSLYQASQATYIGGYVSNYNFTGYIDEVRVCKGVGYNPTTYSIPTRPFMPPAPVLV